MMEPLQPADDDSSEFPSSLENEGVEGLSEDGADIADDAHDVVSEAARTEELSGGPIGSAADVLESAGDDGAIESRAKLRTRRADLETPPGADHNWSQETSAHRIMVELTHVEEAVRAILGPKDPRRKRRLGSERRWIELQDDVLEWKFAGRIADASIAELERLIARHRYLATRLEFLARTRPTWNS